MDNKKMFDG